MKDSTVAFSLQKIIEFLMQAVKRCLDPFSNILFFIEKKSKTNPAHKISLKKATYILCLFLFYKYNIILFKYTKCQLDNTGERASISTVNMISLKNNKWKAYY